MNKGSHLRRYPFRGTLTEIACEEGVTRQAVQKRTSRGDPDTLARIAVKVRERRRRITELEQFPTSPFRPAGMEQDQQTDMRSSNG